MNDNDIIKALECYQVRECEKCVRRKKGHDEELYCRLALIKDTISIITSKNAEIERLKEENETYKERNRIIAYQRDRSNEEIQELHSELSGLNFMKKQIESEAIKYFAERLKNEIDIRPTHSKEQNEFVFFLIDELVKEIGGKM